MIWAPLLLMHQHNLDDGLYKINSGKFIYHMYHGRWRLYVCIVVQFEWNFSFSHYILYNSIWAPLSLMHQQNFDVENYKIFIGECIYSMYCGREILSVWKIFAFMFNFLVSPLKFKSLLRFSSIILSSWYFNNSK